MAGTETNETANILIANTINPAKTAKMMVKKFHVNPAIVPLSPTITPREAMGIRNAIKTITATMARKTPAPMASTTFIPM